MKKTYLQKKSVALNRLTENILYKLPILKFYHINFDTIEYLQIKHWSQLSAYNASKCT